MAAVSEAMTENVVTVNVTASVREAMQALHDSDIRHVPVVDHGELVGIVSDRDQLGLRERRMERGRGP